MHKLEAIKILETKLAAIEQEHHAELGGKEDMRDQADAKLLLRREPRVFSPWATAGKSVVEAILKRKPRRGTAGLSHIRGE
jgi:hypothetical protein